MNYNKKKAFTLIELLIVIAIIGILFIVLVSKVDFATDKAKATGVQTDFRSFQMALETVSKEKAGFNSFGWNTGDANANGVRDSVDEGDANEDGIYQDGETWTGHKKYLETWTNTYSLIRPGTTFEADGYDKDAIFALETAINKNLDPKLHITIANDGKITMANGAQDPWNTQYHGAYISAEDGMDRGAIVMYSNGANQKFGSEHNIANGVPIVIVPGNNKNGADDYSLVVCYTYTNGYGEVGNLTTGFSNNQTFMTGNGLTDLDINNGNGGGEVIQPDTPEEPEIGVPSATFNDGVTLSWDDLQLAENGTKYGYRASEITDTNIGFSAFENCTSLTGIIIPENITEIPYHAFMNCTNLSSVSIPSTTKEIGTSAFENCNNLTDVLFSNGVETIGVYSFKNCTNLTSIEIPDTVLTIGKSAFYACVNLKTLTLGNGLIEIDDWAFFKCSSLVEIVLPNNLTVLGDYAFESCTSITSVKLNEKLTTIGYETFYECSNLTSINIPPSLTNVDHNAFKKCTNLKSVYITDIDKYFDIIFDNAQSAPTCYGAYLYLNNVKVTEVIIPNHITSINAYVFDGCTSIESVIMHDGVTNISEYAFEGCSNLSNVIFSKSLTSIGLGAFSECDSLVSIELPNSLKIINTNAFYSCSSLSNVDLGTGVETIGKQAFINAQLTNLTIPKSVKVLENQSFSQFNNPIEYINYMGTIDEWNNITKDEYWIGLRTNAQVQYVQCSDGQVSLI